MKPALVERKKGCCYNGGVDRATEKKLSAIEAKIEAIRKQLQNTGEMRPGSLTKQYKNPKEKTGAFYQLSYTYKMKSKTEYVRPHLADEVKRQTQNFKKFKKLVDSWIDLALEHAKLKMDFAKKNADS